MSDISDPPVGTGLRARVRAQLVEEIKAVARRHLAAEGANLSLRAVARDLGMVSSAVYRYFASRDDLLTALILDGYNSLGQAVEEAEAVAPRKDLTGRFLAAARGARDWALHHPAEYALLYGSPVPGYAAPLDTVQPATRVQAVLVGILRDGVSAGILTVRSNERLPRSLRAELKQVLTDPRFTGVPEPILARGVTAWLHLFGVLSFELFGQFNRFISERDTFFDHEMRGIAAIVGF
jgi:AcrR family transcriptional regulator